MPTAPFQRLLRTFFRDKYVLWPLVLSLALILLVSALLFAKMPRQTPSGLAIIPLHYNVHFGIDYVGPWFKVFALPGGGLAILFANAVLIWLTYSKGALLGRLLSFGTLLVELTLASAAVFILLFNV